MDLPAYICVIQDTRIEQPVARNQLPAAKSQQPGTRNQRPVSGDKKLKTVENPKRIILWVLVVLYTLAMPYFIFVFSMISRHFSTKTAGHIPLFMIIFLAAAYTAICFRLEKIGRCIGILAIGAAIVAGIMAFEENANKYIHIPEYILMSWLLYRALIIDYRGRGILLLVLICAGMLGVVDEILQGIHPLRTYGWKDMIIDAASSFIGILTIMGLKEPISGDWSWVGYLKHYKAFVGAILFGMPTAVLMCIHLFEVQNGGSFKDVFPSWLLAAQIIIIGWTMATIVFYWNRRAGSGKFTTGQDQNAIQYNTTALLWSICPMVILACMNLLVVWVGVSGLEFG